MDWLQFIASVVGSLAWPVTLIVLLMILKPSLDELAKFVSGVKYKDFEVTFRNALSAAAKQSQSALPAPSEATPPAAADSAERLTRLARYSTRAAILEAWLLIEDSAVDALRARNPSFVPKATTLAPARLGAALNASQILNAAQLEVFNTLRTVRNASIHITDREIQYEEAVEYIDLADSLALQLRRSK